MAAWEATRSTDFPSFRATLGTETIRSMGLAFTLHIIFSRLYFQKSTIIGLPVVCIVDMALVAYTFARAAYIQSEPSVGFQPKL